MLYDGPDAAAFMPVCARYSYEVWVAPKRAVAVVRGAERQPSARDFARALKTVLLKFDGCGSGRFRTSSRSIRRRPTATPHPEAHLHAEFYPAYRMPGRLKYLAGSEIGAGVFTADTLPEEKVEELQRVVVDIDA